MARSVSEEVAELVSLDVERLPIVPAPSDENRAYLDVKRDKLGHFLTH